jgi:hypothetical protein
MSRTSALTVLIGGRGFALHAAPQLQPSGADALAIGGPQGGVAHFVDEDTFSVLAAPIDVRLPEAHPVALFTALHALEPLAVGTTRLERRGGRTRARAVVHDLGAEPTTRPDWVEAAFADGLTKLEAAGVALAVTPVLGTAHAPIARTVALAAMVRGALRVPARATRMVAVVVDAAVDRLALEDVLFARGAPP